MSLPVPPNWRLLEVQSGRSPLGRPWRGLQCQIKRRPATLTEQAKFARYMKLHRRGIDHGTAYLCAFGQESDAEKLAQQFIVEGVLVLPT